ncbi:hypothetical protein D3C85_983280 [compost metagenome]
MLWIDEQAAAIDVVQGDGPELFGRWFAGQVQAIVVATFEPVAGLVGVGPQVGLAQSDGLGDHALGIGDRFIEPGTAFPELVVVGRTLGRLADVEHGIPLAVGPVPGLGEALGEGVGLGDQFTHLRALLQGLALRLGGGEGFVFFDAQAGQHGHVESVAFIDRLALDDLVQALPIFNAAWLGTRPAAAARSQQARLPRLVFLRVGVQAQLFDQGLALGRVGVEHAKAHQHIHALGFGQVILAGIGRRLGARWQNQVFAALALVGPGLAHVQDRPLPDIADAAGSRPGRQFDDHGAGFVEVDEPENIGCGGVGGDDAEFVFVALEDHQVAIAGIEFVVEFLLPLRRRHQRQCPQVSLGGLLVIQFLEQRGNGFTGGQLTVHGQLADVGIECLRLGAADAQAQQADVDTFDCFIHTASLIVANTPLPYW